MLFRKSRFINPLDLDKSLGPPKTQSQVNKDKMMSGDGMSPLPSKPDQSGKSGVKCGKCGHYHKPGSICSFDKSCLDGLLSILKGNDRKKPAGSEGTITRNGQTVKDGGTFAAEGEGESSGTVKHSGPHGSGDGDGEKTAADEGVVSTTAGVMSSDEFDSTKAKEEEFKTAPEEKTAVGGSQKEQDQLDKLMSSGAEPQVDMRTSSEDEGTKVEGIGGGKGREGRQKRAQELEDADTAVEPPKTLKELQNMIGGRKYLETAPLPERSQGAPDLGYDEFGPDVAYDDVLDIGSSTKYPVEGPVEGPVEAKKPSEGLQPAPDLEGASEGWDDLAGFMGTEKEAAPAPEEEAFGEGVGDILSPKMQARVAKEKIAEDRAKQEAAQAAEQEGMEGPSDVMSPKLLAQAMKQKQREAAADAMAKEKEAKDAAKQEEKDRAAQEKADAKAQAAKEYAESPEGRLKAEKKYNATYDAAMKEGWTPDQAHAAATQASGLESRAGTDWQSPGEKRAAAAEQKAAERDQKAADKEQEKAAKEQAAAEYAASPEGQLKAEKKYNATYDAAVKEGWSPDQAHAAATQASGLESKAGSDWQSPGEKRAAASKEKEAQKELAAREKEFASDPKAEARFEKQRQKNLDKQAKMQGAAEAKRAKKEASPKNQEVYEALAAAKETGATPEMSMDKPAPDTGGLSSLFDLSDDATTTSGPEFAKPSEPMAPSADVKESAKPELPSFGPESKPAGQAGVRGPKTDKQRFKEANKQLQGQTAAGKVQAEKKYGSTYDTAIKQGRSPEEAHAAAAEASGMGSQAGTGWQSPGEQKAAEAEAKQHQQNQAKMDAYQAKMEQQRKPKGGVPFSQMYGAGAGIGASATQEAGGVGPTAAFAAQRAHQLLNPDLRPHTAPAFAGTGTGARTKDRHPTGTTAVTSPGQRAAKSLEDLLGS